MSEKKKFYYLQPGLEATPFRSLLRVCFAMVARGNFIGKIPNALRTRNQMNDLPITNSGVFSDGDLGKLGKNPNALSKESNLRPSDF